MHHDGMSHAAIARELGVSRPTIIDWLKEKMYADHRGWKDGVKRSHTTNEEERIIALKQQRIDQKKYFLGTPHIQMDYAKQYPADPLPSTWFFDEVIRNHHLQTHEPKQRTKGQSIVSRLKFPITSIVKLGKIQQASDFIGKKYIAGSREPVSIFSTSFYQWFQLYQIQRVLAEKAEYAIECLTNFWTRFPIPDVMRVDNSMTFRGTGRGVACIGRFVTFLLNLRITPIFSAAYQSYTNPHIEGHNRTFTEKLWRRNHFTDRAEIDRECERFNTESQEYFSYRFKERLLKKNIRYLGDSDIIDSNILRSTKGKKIYFIRFVERWKESDDRIGIVILNRFVPIPEPYSNQYVLATLDLASATLSVESEYDRVATIILRLPFQYTLL